MRKNLDKVARFFREVRAELGKVIWPDRRNIGVYTGVVIATVVVIMATIWVADIAVGEIIALMLR